MALMKILSAKNLSTSFALLALRRFVVLLGPLPMASLIVSIHVSLLGL